jgi:hypothetical protein
MRIGLVGATSQQLSLPFNAERTINFFPVLDQQGKEVSALYGTAGLKLFANLGAQEMRGAFTSSNERCFFVSGSKLYEILSNGNSVERGTLLTSFGNVSMDENGVELSVCDGQNLYIFNYSTNVFQKVSDIDLPANVGIVTAIDGYFVVNEVSTGKFYVSDIRDGLNWNALEFATAESNPDNLVSVKNAIGQLWLFGTKTTEIWTNTGSGDFPFLRISGAIMEVGCLAPHSVVDVANSIAWVGRDKHGQNIVYSAQGFTPRAISTEPINILLSKATNPSEIRGYVYQEHGHTFYILTGGGLETTLCYDITTQQWHERSYNDNGRLSQHLAGCCTFAFGKQLVGSRRDGKIYEMSLSYYGDDGEDIVSERIYTHLSDMNKRIRYNVLEISMETGVGQQTGVTDPLISMQLSKDGARTWSNWYTDKIGKVGEYMTKVQFRRLGIAEQMTFKIRISAQVKKALTGSYLS